MPKELPISPIPASLLLQIRSLARAAYILRGVFVLGAEGKPVSDILDERGGVLELANKVLDRWFRHLGLDEEALAG